LTAKLRLVTSAATANAFSSSVENEIHGDLGRRLQDSWSRCAVEQSWRLPMNLVPSPEPSHPGEGELCGRPGTFTFSDFYQRGKCEFPLLGVLGERG
jgi:hypothetical protein